MFPCHLEGEVSPGQSPLSLPGLITDWTSGEGLWILQSPHISYLSQPVTSHPLSLLWHHLLTTFWILSDNFVNVLRILSNYFLTILWFLWLFFITFVLCQHLETLLWPLFDYFSKIPLLVWDLFMKITAWEHCQTNNYIINDINSVRRYLSTVGA